MKQYLEIEVKEEEAGKIRRILKEAGLTERQISRAKFLPDGICRNGVRCRVTEAAAAGDAIRVCLETDEVSSAHLVKASEEAPELHILYEDDHILAVNKPVGLVTHPTGGHYSDSLANQVAGYYREKGQNLCVRPVGRLDKETSGIVIFGKNQAAAAALQRQRENGILVKTYLAFVNGWLPLDGENCWHTIDVPLMPDPGCPQKMRALLSEDIFFKIGSHNADKMISKVGNGHVDGLISEENNRQEDDRFSSKRAVTRYQTLYSTPGWSLLRFRLETGRTHQIRVHMAALGHSLLGDILYSEKKSASANCPFFNIPVFTRTALHAWKVHFQLPFEGRTVSLEAPLPEDMRKIFILENGLNETKKQFLSEGF